MKNDRMDSVRGVKVVRLLFAALVAAICAGMWGCSDRVDFEWGVYRSDESVAGFIDDSLVIVTDCRRWHEITETWNGGYSEETSCGHDRMLVYNYRVQEERPRWTDSLTNKSDGGYWKQLTDSIIWRWNGKNIKLWKVYGEERELSLKEKNDGCSQRFEINRMHQWKNGLFVALGANLSAKGDSCQYAVLDTAARILTYKRLGKNLEWIQKCDDVRAWDENVYCIAMLNNPKDLFLLKNDENLDSLIHGDGYKWTENSIVVFSGQILNLSGNIGLLKDDRIELFSNADLKGLIFRDLGGSLITY